MAEGLVSVVIPTYGRAGLLARTVPTYLQPGVGEVIVVDDASPDDTARVLGDLAAADPRIRALRSPVNRKQTHAKNLGIAAARFPLVYFGDDDSLLSAGSIAFLLETMTARGADIVGARAPYLKDGEGPETPARPDPEGRTAPTALKVDWRSLHADFGAALAGPVEAPFVHAAFLARRELALATLFDEAFTGNCYREETDFILRAAEGGARIWFDPRAVQTNLPRSASGGGAHGSGGSLLGRKLRYYGSSARNNLRFLRRHHAWLAGRHPVPRSVARAQLAFILSMFRAVAVNLSRRAIRWPRRSS